MHFEHQQIANAYTAYWCDVRASCATQYYMMMVANACVQLCMCECSKQHYRISMWTTYTAHPLNCASEQFRLSFSVLFTAPRMRRERASEPKIKKKNQHRKKEQPRIMPYLMLVLISVGNASNTAINRRTCNIFAVIRDLNCVLNYSHHPTENYARIRLRAVWSVRTIMCCSECAAMLANIL